MYFFRIKKEIELLSLSNHKNVVRIYGCSPFSDNVEIIMEYMAGGSLLSLMMRSADDCFLVSIIPYSLRLRFFSDVCSGVTYLHHNFGDERIIHGDIKPANILLSKHLDCEIADFGGATIATISDNITQPQPRERGAQETLGFIAPERKSSDIRLSKAMDVYSVGATFYLILQREHPAKI